LSYSDGAVDGSFYKFDLSTLLDTAFLAAGSVQVMINGVYAASADDQLDNDQDFYIEQQAVVWTNNSFALDSNDEITIYFQKE